MLPETVDVETMAKLLDLTPRRVQQLVDEGYCESRGRNEYVLQACVQGVIRYWRERAEGRAAVTELSQEKLLDARLKNRKREIEIAQLEGSVITVDSHRKALEEAFTLVRSNLLNLPGSMADQLIGIRDKRDVVAVLQPAVDRALHAVTRQADELERVDHLPEDFPGRAALEEHGVRTLAELRALQDVTEVKGIGPATAKKIRRALKAL